MIRISFNGVLGADAEVREVGKRKAINLSIAVHKEYKNSDGGKVEKTEWIKGVIWKNADRSTKVADYLKKGTKVIVEGEPGVDAFISKDGSAAGSLTVNIKEIEFLS